MKKYNYVWYGFPAFCMFCFGKWAGFIPYSWFWILVTFIFIVKREVK